MAVWIVVTKTELNGALNMYEWRPFALAGDTQQYYECYTESGRRMILVKQGEMGMTSCAALCEKCIWQFRPKYLIMVGIAAGTAHDEKDVQEYGDVIVADVAWNYSAGKYVSKEEGDICFGNLGFISRPAKITLLDGIREYIEAAIASPENECYVHIGPIATGTAVVANSELLRKQIYSQMIDNAGLDMEAYAVAYCAQNATQPKPCPLIIKSVSDFADHHKDDRFQKFAAYTAAQFARLLCEKFLP